MARKLKDYLFHYWGCECVADMSRYVGKVGKKYSLKAVPVIFDSINRNNDIDQCWGVKINDEEGLEFFDVFDKKCRIWEHFIHSTELKPILRPFSDLKESEALLLLNFDNDIQFIKFWGIDAGENRFTWSENIFPPHTPETWCLLEARPEQFAYLINQRIDIFNLIPEGLAVDATKFDINSLIINQ